jgi:hypothetical protein
MKIYLHYCELLFIGNIMLIDLKIFNFIKFSLYFLKIIDNIYKVKIELS